MTHLKKRDDIARLLVTGKKSGSGIVSIKYKKNELDECRFLFIPQRNFGGAVKRNLIRRRLNEICRHNRDRIVKGYDIGIYVKNDVILIADVWDMRRNPEILTNRNK